MGCKSAILGLLVSFGLFAGVCFGKYSGGMGEPNDPYLIATPNDLNSIGLDSNDWDKHFKMTADINLASFTGTQFNIIGGSSPYFSGAFDGNDHQITAFTYIDKTRVKAGVFGHATEDSAIRNVHLVDVNLCGYYDVGGLVGKNYGKVKNCFVTGVIAGTWDVGGLVGENYEGLIERCGADVEMQNYGVQEEVGCLVGFNQSDIIDCSSAGIVDGNDSTNSAGGLVGHNAGKIKRCYSTADVKGSWCIGGLVGVHDWVDYDLQSCYATGDVLAEVRGGGLVGFSTSTVINCYATGDVNCTRASGGLIGEEGYGGAINCYSTGCVTGSQDVGGLVGLKYTDGFVGCFWDVNTSGQTTSASGTGLPTAEMQTRSTFVDAGWDFVGEISNGYEDFWRMCWDGGWYPRLAWQFYKWADFVCPDRVELSDFAYFAARWRQTNCADSNNCDGADLDYSGAVDYNDLKEFGELWLKGRPAPGELAVPVGVDFADYAELAKRWLNEKCRLTHNCYGTDLDFSGIVDWADLKILADHWLEGTE